MMKKLRQWLPPLFALLLTAAGAASASMDQDDLAEQAGNIA